MWDCERNQEAKFFYNSPRLPGGTGQKGYSRNDTPIISLKHRNKSRIQIHTGNIHKKDKSIKFPKRYKRKRGIHNANKTAVKKIVKET